MARLRAMAAAAAVAAAWRMIGPRLPRPGDPVAALARNPQIAGLAPGPAHEIAHPLAGALDVAGVLRVGADARDANELGQVVEPGLVHGA